MKKKSRWLIGIDEVGRGPLAGPITIGVVALKGSYALHASRFKNIKDSKRLSSKKREEWFRRIRAYSQNSRINSRVNSRVFSVTSSVSPQVIDRIGIAHAARLAIRRSLTKLEKRYMLRVIRFKIMLDGGLRAPKEYRNQKTISKGDQKIPVIAAASIIAKVTRDRKMVRLAKCYPQYEFDVHKAYGTRAHMKAIRKHGLCDIHRRSFCKKFL